MRATGKIVVVTGAGNGIGRELVLQLLQKGASVYGADIDEKGLAETRLKAGPTSSALETGRLDLSKRDEIRALPKRVTERFGGVDGLINCAGIIQPFVKVAKLDDATIDRVFTVNWQGTLEMCRAFLPLLEQRPEAHVVNVSSMGGFLPVPGQSIYGASKAAVKLFTEALRTELLGSPVKVTLVIPGAIGTNIVANSGVQRLETPESKTAKTLAPSEAARQIIAAMERDAFRVIVGNDAKLLDALYRVSPKRAAELIGKQLGHLLK